MKLKPVEIRIRLRKLRGWKLAKDEFSGCQSIRKKFVSRNFLQAMKFINKVAKTAERYGHHPDIHLIQWNKVVITIYTHSMKGITEWDFELAELIDKIK